MNGYYQGNSLDEKSWLALTERIFCWKIFQRTERKSQQFCFTWLNFGTIRERKKVFGNETNLAWKLTNVGIILYIFYLCFTLLFDLEDHQTKVFMLDSDFCYPAICKKYHNQQMNPTQLGLHSNNLANVIKHEFYHIDEVQLLKFNSFRISLHFCIYTLRWHTLTSFVCIPNQ